MVRSLDQWRRGETTALPAWMKPQLTKLVDEPPEEPAWLHEIKFDGYRMHAPSAAASGYIVRELRYFPSRSPKETRIHKWDQEFESAFLQRRVR